jgi:carboxymethylenebutenolidase
MPRVGVLATFGDSDALARGWDAAFRKQRGDATARSDWCREIPMKKAKKVKPAKKVKTAKKVKKMDLGAVFDAHVRHEFVDHDVAATMKTMAAEPYVHNVPTLTGGDGHAGVVEFYTQHFVGKMPADTRVEQISRTVGKDQVVDELILYFTHDCPIDFMLPGIPPTGRKVALPHVVVMKFKGDKVAHEHIYWDQACVLAQIGLLDPSKLPVTGARQAEVLVQKSRR